MENYIEKRPWGEFEILKNIQIQGENVTADSCVKKITVKQKSRLSYQSHAQRAEHWFFVQGQGTVVLDDKEYKVYAGKHVDIALGQKLRVINDQADLELVFIEISAGHFDEKDIVRYEDDYGRVEK